MPYCKSCCLGQECYIWGLEELYKKYNRWMKKGIKLNSILDLMIEEWTKRLGGYYGCCFLWFKEFGIPYNNEAKIKEARRKLNLDLE